MSRWCFNCYLIAGDNGGLVVVDAGMPDIADDLEPLLADASAQVTVVTATHGHPDHIGGAATLVQRHNAEIHLPTTTMTYLNGATPRTPSVGKLARTWPLLFGQPFDLKAATGFVRATSAAGFGTSRGMQWRGQRPAGGLDDGAPLPGAPSWTVLNSPGHTDDSITLWHEHSRTLLSGDAVITIKNKPRFAPDTSTRPPRRRQHPAFARCRSSICYLATVYRSTPAQSGTRWEGDKKHMGCLG